MTPTFNLAQSYTNPGTLTGDLHNRESRTVVRPLLSLINTWVLCFILLVLASTYGFSFERGSKNTTSGAAEQGIAKEDSGESALVKVQEVGVYFLSACVILPFIKPVGAEFWRNLLITALVCWAVASCFWSQDDLTSAKSAVRMTLDIALAFYLFKRFAINDLMRLLILVGAVAAAGSLILIVAFPQYGLLGRDANYALGAWQGIFGHKNICGRMMTLLLLPVFFVQVNDRRTRLLRFSYVAVVVLIIGMTHSAGSWLLCGGCLAFAWALHVLVKLKRIDALIVGIATGAVIAVVLMAVLNKMDAFLLIIGKDPTMTGRTIIWTSLLASISKHPLIGYGYSAFWLGLTGESVNPIVQLHWPGMGYAENGVLELWLELGAVAVILYAWLFFRAVKDALFCLRNKPSKGTMWFTTMLFYVAFTNVWAGNLLTPSNLECILPFVAFVGLRSEASRVRDMQVL